MISIVVTILYSIATLLAGSCFAEPANIATADGSPDIRFDFLDPGFAVRELPLRLPNLIQAYRR